MSCDIVDTIGTGDCEKLEKNCKSEENFANVIASELVSEIIENALDVVEDIEEKGVSNVGDILENLSNKFQELAISEEKSKFSDSMEGSHAEPFTGVGDHIKADKEVSASPLVKQPPVEKKSRLTDLVKNSKQLLAKLMLADNKGEARDTKSEKVLRVVELDYKEDPFNVHPTPAPEDVSLPRNYSEDILECPTEDNSLDEIPLPSKDNDDIKKTLTFPLAGSSCKTLMNRYRTLKLTTDFKKKKWNIGTKIINYIRKQQVKRQGNVVSDGVEITPQAEES